MSRDPFRRGGPRGRVTLDFRKIKEAGRLVEVTEQKKEMSETILDDIELVLTQTDRDNMAKFSEGGKKLYIVLRKCHKSKRFDIVSSKFIAQLLEETEDDIPVLKPNTQSLAICSHADDPHNFCLQWLVQEQRLYLLSSWIEDMVKRKKLVPFDSVDTLSLVGSMVFVRPRSISGMVRGEITRCISDMTVTVYFVDYGKEETFDLDELYDQPPEIAKIPPMCFSATLENVQLPHNCDSFDWQTKDVFSMSMDSVGEMDCVITAVNENSSKVKYSVHLWKILGNDEQEDIGLAVEESMSKRLNIQKVVNIEDSLNPNVDEVSLLLFNNQTVEIHPYVHRDFKEIRTYRFLNIISPAEFYLEYVSGSMIEDRKEEIMKTLQTFYAEQYHMEIYKIKTRRLFKGRCYAWHNPKDKRWYRVRVIESKVAEKAQVWLVDTGIQEVVSINDMMELDPTLATLNGLASKAHLVDIKASGGAQEWSEKVCTFLREMCSPEKIFSGITMTIVTSNRVSYNPADASSYGMMLAENKKDTPGPINTVQTVLVQNKLAEGCGPSAGQHDLAYYLSGTQLCYNRYYANKKFSLESFPIKTTSEVAKEQQAYLRGNLLNGTELRLLQIRGSDQFTYYRDELKESKLSLPDQMKRNLACVNICPVGSVLGPSQFYIQMTSKTSELEQMMEDLEKVVTKLGKESSSEIKEEDIVPGLIAVLQVLDEKAIPFWSRVVVKTYIKSIKLVKVILIDFGLESSAKTSTLRYLPKYFENIAPFCHRVHLENNCLTFAKVVMPISGHGWSSVSTKAFKKVVHKWNKNGQFFYAWQQNMKRIVRLEEFNQNLLYDGYTESWYPGPVLEKAEYLPINAKKDHPLLAHFFTSIGIDMAYESADSQNGFYQFIPIWKTLVETVQAHGI